MTPDQLIEVLPKWLDAPDAPGLWLSTEGADYHNRCSWKVCAVDSDTINDPMLINTFRDGSRYYGPIPIDMTTEGAA